MKNLIPYTVLALALMFQVYFRFYNLEFHGLWRDEVATMFFSHFPLSSVAGDSHSFFYYLLIGPLSLITSSDIFSLRVFHGILGLIILGIAVLRGRKLFSFDQWIFIFSIYSLHPVVFGFSRLARPYGLLMDLSLLFIIECRLLSSRKSIFALGTLLGVLHPFGLFVLGFEYVYSKHKDFLWKTLLIASIPSLLYYGAKFLFIENQLGFISWIQVDSVIFLKDLSGLLFGSFYPYYNDFSPFFGVWLLVFFAILSLFVMIFFNDETVWIESAFFFGIFFFIYITFNGISFFQDLRISRYFVFLVPYFVIYLSALLTRKEAWALPSTLVLLGLIFFQIVYYRPFFTPQASFDSFTREIRVFSESFNSPVLACGQRFHNWYFETLGFKSCQKGETVIQFSEMATPYIYAYIDRSFTPIIFFGNNFKTHKLNLRPEGNILVISNTREANHAESK